MRIYLIDDDDSLRDALRRVLERAGHEVRVAENGLAAKRTVRDWTPDVVICDMLMPDAEGFEVLRAVRNMVNDAKFVMMSGASGELSGFLDRAPLLGADAVLQKPFPPQKLLSLVDSLVGKASTSEVHARTVG